MTWLSEEDVAQRLRELREDPTAWLGRTFSGQFSLAGVQAKTALLYQEGRWGVPSGPIPTTHILKPAISGFDDHDLNEHLCMDAGRRCGLLVARTKVERFSAESAVVVSRYDRVGKGRAVARVHQEDVCQALWNPAVSEVRERRRSWSDSRNRTSAARNAAEVRGCRSRAIC